MKKGGNALVATLILGSVVSLISMALLAHLKTCQQELKLWYREQQASIEASRAISQFNAPIQPTRTTIELLAGQGDWRIKSQGIWEVACYQQVKAELALKGVHWQVLQQLVRVGTKKHPAMAYWQRFLWQKIVLGQVVETRLSVPSRLR